MRLLVTDAAAQPPRQATAWLIMTLGKPNHFLIRIVLQTNRQNPCDDEAIEPTLMILRSLTDSHLTAGKLPRGDSLSKAKSPQIAEFHVRHSAETFDHVLRCRASSKVSA
jgi:hypothetical protein